MVTFETNSKRVDCHRAFGFFLEARFFRRESAPCDEFMRSSPPRLCDRGDYFEILKKPMDKAAFETQTFGSEQVKKQTDSNLERISGDPNESASKMSSTSIGWPRTICSVSRWLSLE
jgi:hypothetical protein